MKNSKNSNFQLSKFSTNFDGNETQDNFDENILLYKKYENNKLLAASILAKILSIKHLDGQENSENNIENNQNTV